MTYQERRQNARVRHRRKVGFILSNGELEYLWSHEISHGGMHLLTEHSFDLGDLFTVVMQLQLPGEKLTERVEIKARISHVIYDSAHRCNRIGLEFIEFIGNCLPHYQRYVDHYLDNYENTVLKR